MSERMKALPFVVYEFFTRNCERTSLETLPILAPSFQFLSKGKESHYQEGDNQEIQKVRLSVNRIKRYFRMNFCSNVVICSFSKKSYSVVFLLTLTL